MKKNISQPDSIVNLFYENVPELQPITTDCLIDINDFSNLCIEAIYVIDFKNRCFQFVSNHDLFLCGHSRDEVLHLGYDFYSKVVHKDDLLQLEEMHRAILTRLCNPAGLPAEIDHFSCTFRIKNRLQQKKQPEYLMIYQKLIPKFVDGEIQFGICLLTSSVIKTAGNLQLYYKNNLYFEEYSFANKKWKIQQIDRLTEREISILRYAKQGLNLREISEILCITYNAVQKTTADIYDKFSVHTIEQAVIYANNRLLVFQSNCLDTPQKKPECKTVKCHKRFTAEDLQHIQECLDNSEHIRSIAKRGNFSESAIRKQIQSGKLKRKNG